MTRIGPPNQPEVTDRRLARATEQGSRPPAMKDTQKSGSWPVRAPRHTHNGGRSQGRAGEAVPVCMAVRRQLRLGRICPHHTAPRAVPLIHTACAASCYILSCRGDFCYMQDCGRTATCRWPLLINKATGLDTRITAMRAATGA